MPASSYLEPKILDALFGNVAGAMNQNITAGTVVTSLTVKGASGASGLDAAIPANSLIIVATPGAAGTENAMTNAELFQVTAAGAAAAATSVPVASQTTRVARAIGDVIIPLGPSTAMSPVLMPNTLYIGLSTGLASAAVAEPTIGTGGYVRIKVVNNAVNWAAATGSNPATKSNAAAQSFPQSTAAWSSGATALQSYFVNDASTGGNVLFQANLNTAQTVNASGITPSFAVSALSTTAT